MKHILIVLGTLALLSGFLAAGIGESHETTEDPASDTLTRAEEWRQARLQKGGAKTVEKQSGIEKALLYVEDRRLDEIISIRYKDFYPKFGTISPGSGLGVGLRFFKKAIGGGPVTLESSFLNSFRNYRNLDLSFGRFNRLAPAFFVGPPEFGAPFEFGEPGPREVDRNRLFLYGDFNYQYLPQEVFYGIGNDSQRDNRTSYLNEHFRGSVVAGYQFTNWLASGARFGYQKHNIEPGESTFFPSTQEIFDDAAAPGLEGQPGFLVFSAGLFINYTDRPGNPHRGGAIGLGYARLEDRDGGLYDFNQYTVDVRQYVPLGSPQRTFAIRVFTVQNRPDGGSRVPFYLQPVLGGSTLLRGYREFRFRDDNLVYLSGEYRWEPAPAFEMALFYDTGKVYSTEEDLEWNGFKKNLGIGFRFKTAWNTIVRLDVGRGTEGTLVQFRFGPVF